MQILTQAIKYCRLFTLSLLTIVLLLSAYCVMSHMLSREIVRYEVPFNKSFVIESLTLKPAANLLFTITIKKDWLDDTPSLRYLQFPLSYEIRTRSGKLLATETLSIKGTRDKLIHNLNSLNDEDYEILYSSEKFLPNDTTSYQLTLSIAGDEGIPFDKSKVELSIQDRLLYQPERYMMLSVYLFVVSLIFFLLQQFIKNLSKTIEADPDALKITPSAKAWAIICHSSVYVGVIIPFTGILAVLFTWLYKREQHDFIDLEGRHALNFRINMYLYYLLAAILCFVLIGFILLPILIIIDLILPLLAAKYAATGHDYRYPVLFKFV